MAHSETVLDVGGSRWVFSMADQVTLSQPGAATLNLSGTANPLVIDIRLTPDLLFSAATHGIVSIDMHEVDATSPNAADPSNGLRGPIEIVLHNEMGIPLLDPPGGATMALYAAGVSDQFPSAPAAADSFHTLYTHFHGIQTSGATQTFPGFAVTPQVGPYQGAEPGSAAAAPNWLLLDGTLASGATLTSQPFTFHRRDTAVSDDASINLIVLDGAFAPAALAQVRAQWDAANGIAIAALSASKAEGNTGTTPFTFTVTRGSDTSAAVTLNYAVTGTGTNPATAADFANNVLPSGTVVLAAGEASKVITVNVAGDTVYEPDKTFAVTLTGASGTTIRTPSATGTILNDDPGALLAFRNATSNQSGLLAMDAPGPGAPNYLQWQYIYSGSDNLSISVQTPNVFIHSGSGFDAIQVTSGNNVLDGGLGSNFLTGGSGNDTFFTDARSPGVVWNTLRNFHAGDAATLWGYTPGVSSYRWEAGVAGAPGSEGATLRANIVGGNGRIGDGIDASITFSGMSVESAKNLQLVTGTQPAGSYLYIYNPGV